MYALQSYCVRSLLIIVPMMHYMFIPIAESCIDVRHLCEKSALGTYCGVYYDVDDGQDAKCHLQKWRRLRCMKFFEKSVCAY